MLAILMTAGFLVLESCGESYDYTAHTNTIGEGETDSTSQTFRLNRSPIKLEVYARLVGADAVITLDHPDGRRTESIALVGDGIRDIQREYDKEPGSWGLNVTVKTGRVDCWLALHDRKKFVGPSDEVRNFVEGKR